MTAHILGIDQPKVSHVLHGRLAGSSTQRLLGFLTSLDQDVDIFVRPAPAAPPARALRAVMTKLASRRENDLLKRVAEIIEAARGRVARTVNSAMVHAYWLRASARAST